MSEASPEALAYVREQAHKRRPRPLGSLVASARRLTSTTAVRMGSASRGWQEDAWEMYDLVGEERFLATVLAGRLAQARFYVGQVTDDQTEAPQPLDPEQNPATDQINEVLNAVGGGSVGLSQIVQRLGVNLFVAGDGWVAGIPKSLMPPTMLAPTGLSVVPPPQSSYNPAYTAPPPVGTLDITDLEWRMLSVSELTSAAGGEVTLILGETEAEKISCNPDELFLIRVWRPHPRKWWEADSPTRSSLAVLRELVGLTMHISAQVDSRLAGAGVLIMPQSAQAALKAASGSDPNADDDTDEFTEALMEAMLKPITDRANASALVPLVVTVPDDACDKFNYLTFAKPLDTEARSLRDEAIRRLALGQDAPPELLLGTAGMNHWGAWLVREDVITTHLEPPLALICDALTTQYMWPVLAEMMPGLSEDELHRYVVWYDVSHMIMRPNRSADALTLHDRGVVTDAALRDATGFGDSDAPAYPDGTPDHVRIALELAKTNPQLFVDPGVPQLAAQIWASLTQPLPAYVDPSPPPALSTAPSTGPATTPPPPTADQPPTQPGTATPVTETNPPPPPAAIAASVTPIGGGQRLIAQTFALGSVAQPELPYGN